MESWLVPLTASMQNNTHDNEQGNEGKTGEKNLQK